MMKQKSVFKCQECGYNSSKWLGRCPECGEWNTLVEEIQVKSVNNKISCNAQVSTLESINCENIQRIPTGINELDRILGNGMVPCSIILLGGAPGIGKSTLLLDMACSCAKKVLYVSGEESLSQIKLRSNRLGINSNDIFLLSTNNVIDIETQLKKVKPQILIIDSIQTIAHPELTGIAGSIGQVREVTNILTNIAKRENIIVFLIGHITKEGMLAGPKVLEHIVDTVLYFEDENRIYRIIRCIKNRFGPTSEIAVFEMTHKGLIQVDNLEKIFYIQDEEEFPGTVLTSVVEGTRPIIIEVQALVSKTSYGIARRQATGMDYNRLIFLIAVIEKKLGISLASFDIFVNIVGGIKIKEPAIDCAVIASILSSFYDITIPKNNLFIGEIGLGGEIRNVSFLEERLKRAVKMGIKQCVTAYNTKEMKKISGLKIQVVKDLKGLYYYVKAINISQESQESEVRI
ncbi:DNA repair protein RadA [bacterium]